jgi:ADP-ribose pyrophosphatase YjhB (NUDIX family)
MTRLPMPTIGVNVAVFKDDKLLLTQREDFEIWSSPAGGFDPGESISQTAWRELCEETGLEVVLGCFAGACSELGRPKSGLHVVLFFRPDLQRQVNLQTEEVLDLRFFGLDELPDNLLYGHRQRALDALAEIGVSAVWTQSTPWPLEPALSRGEIYQLHDRSWMSPVEFFNHYLNKNTSTDEKQDLNGER